MKSVARMELRPGMTLGEDVVWHGSSIYFAGTVLTQNMINKLQRYSIVCVTVMEEVDFATTHYEKLRYSQEFKTFEKKHEESLNKFRQLMDDFSTKRTPISEDVLMSIYDDLRATYPSGAVLLDYLYNLMANEDQLTFNHCLNSALLVGAFAEWNAMPVEERKYLILSGFYYDIGKLKLPYDLLWRPGKLTDKEYDMVKRHPAIGWAMLGNSRLDPRIQDAVLMHHERADGSGYPHHLKGDEISLYARYLAIVDTYIAMASPRPHRDALTPLQILGHLETEISKYDANLLMPLMKRIADAQIGSNVCLSDESVWEVFIIHTTRYSRPVLKNEKSQILDLLEHPELEIVKMI